MLERNVTSCGGREQAPRPYDGSAVNFTREVVDAAPHDRLALVALAAGGSRREVSFGEVSEPTATPEWGANS